MFFYAKHFLNLTLYTHNLNIIKHVFLKAVKNDTFSNTNIIKEYFARV